MQIVLPRPQRTLLSPTEIAGLAAWYDVSDRNSLVVDGSNRVSLVADKSGNSAVNCLCLNGAGGNYASAPDSAALSVADVDLQALVVLDDWTPATQATVISKRLATGSQCSYALSVSATTGTLRLDHSLDGTTANEVTTVSSVAPTVSDLGKLWIRATRSSATGAIRFYTGGSADTPSWVQLGSDRTSTAGSPFDSTASVNVGGWNNGGTNLPTGRVYRAIIRNGYDGAGSVVFDANFALASKLATSFTESSSNAATVTINSSGDLGARICGERDLVQLTAAKQPIYDAATRSILFDGTNHYMKAAAFALSQPESVYFVGQQVSWTANDRIYCGNTDTTTQLEQIISSPQVFLRSSSGTDIISSWAIGTTAIITAIYNSTSSFLRRNRDTAVGPSTNNTVGNGFTLGAQASGINPSNIRFNEAIIRSAADATAVQDRFILRAGQKWGFSV